MKRNNDPSDSEKYVFNLLLENPSKMSVREICAIRKEREGVEWNPRTVSTFLKRLEEKGFVKHEKIVITNYYHVAIEKKEYKKQAIKEFLKSYYRGSITNMLSAFTEGEKLSKEEVEDIQSIIDKFK